MKYALAIALRQNDNSLCTVVVVDKGKCRQRDECKPVASGA